MTPNKVVTAELEIKFWISCVYLEIESMNQFVEGDKPCVYIPQGEEGSCLDHVWKVKLMRPR